MADVLGRTVLSRHRYARVWGLGDRKQPSSQTPGVVLLEGDPSLPLNYAPFESSTTPTLPANLNLRSRGAFSPPQFTEILPNYSVSIGHVLPPSLEDANAGEPQGTSELLPVSWQRMHHDASLTDASLSPEIVVLTDAVQLASQPGKLPSAIIALKHRFPGALLWTPGIGGPDNLAALVHMGVDLVDLARCHQAVAVGMVLRCPAHAWLSTFANTKHNALAKPACSPPMSMHPTLWSAFPPTCSTIPWLPTGNVSSPRCTFRQRRFKT